VLRALRKTCWDGLHNGAALLGFGIASYRQPERITDFKHVREARQKREILLTPMEANQLCALVRATSKLGGCMAEIGVYRGASARLIHNNDPARPLHLFDTFEGLPEPSQDDTEFRNGQFAKGQFACGLDEVKAYLGSPDSIVFHQGLFPDTAGPVQHEQFSFVHTDVDLYGSTRSVLEFFYPRLLPGGIILSHDFHSCRGPHQAISEFFSDKPEPVIELPGDQALIVKI
jgi:O-methyltransferase